MQSVSDLMFHTKAQGWNKSHLPLVPPIYLHGKQEYKCNNKRTIIDTVT